MNGTPLLRLAWRCPAGRPTALALAAAALACGPGGPTPPVEGVLVHCAEPRRDFGTVWEGEVLEHEFRLAVLGVEDLVVANTRGDCGCTVAELELLEPAGTRRVVEPGESVPPGSELALRVRYDTRGRRGSTDRTVKVYCNEPDGVFEVALGARVEPRFTTDPDPPPWIDTSLGETASSEFVVRAASDAIGPFHLEHEARGLPEALRVELAPEAPSDSGRAGRWRVRLEAGAGTPRGTHTYPVRLVASGLPDLAAGEVAVYAPFVTVRVQGAFSASPPSISFGGVASADTVSQTVRVQCNDASFAFEEPQVRLVPIAAGRPLRIDRTAELHTHPVPGENAWDVELVLQGLDPETERTFLAKLVIETAHEVEPRVEVNVSGFRLDGGPGGRLHRRDVGLR